MYHYQAQSREVWCGRTLMLPLRLCWHSYHAVLRASCCGAELMLRKKLPPAPPTAPTTITTHASSDIDYTDIAAKLEGYSGSDIALLCKEAAMRPVRRLMEKLEAIDSGSIPSARASAAVDLLRVDAVSVADLNDALTVTKPSARVVAPRYTAWQAEFAST